MPFLDHSMTEAEREAEVKRIAADMRKAMSGWRQKPSSDAKLLDGYRFFIDPIFAGGEGAAATSTPVEQTDASTDADAQRAISVAMKAFAALCRQGIETVELDGETIDLWDVKRDLRSLLGPDET